MFFPPQTLADVALLSLILAGMFRLFLVLPSCVAIVRMFENKYREGFRLFRSLGVPGLNSFIRQEVLLAMVPFLVLAGVLILDDRVVILNEMSNPQRVITFGVFVLWVFFDGLRSYTAGAHLRMMASETKSFGKKMAVSALDGLRYAVYLRPSVSKTALKLGQRAAITAAQNRVKEHEEDNRRTAGTLAAMMFLERFVSFPERIIGRVTDFGKERLEAKWEDAFVSYANRAWWVNLLILFWGFVPTFWLFGMTVALS